MLTIPCANYLLDRKFVFTEGSHVFTLNHLKEIGVLEEYLKKECSANTYKICNYTNALNNQDFMWDLESPVYKMGGWSATKSEFNSIIKDILLSPEYYSTIISQGINYSYRQLIEFHSTVDIPQKAGSPPHGLIYWRFNASENAYLTSVQNTIGYQLKSFNRFEYLIMVVSIVVLTVLLVSKQLLPAQISAIIFCTLLVIVSAVICSNLSTVNARYVNRVIWLIPFLVFGSGIHLLLSKTSR